MKVESSHHFKKHEVECKCCGVSSMDHIHMKRMDDFRKAVGKSVFLSSGYRCEKHNADVGGKPNSAHTKGLACDVIVPNTEDMYFFIKAAYRVGFPRIGASTDQKFMHLDSDTTLPTPRFWTY